MIYYVNYLLTTRPLHDWYLSPQIECGDITAAVPLSTTKVDRTATKMWEHMFSLLGHYNSSFSIKWSWSTHNIIHISSPNWIWRFHGCCLLLTIMRNRYSQCTVRKWIFPFSTLILWFDIFLSTSCAPTSYLSPLIESGDTTFIITTQTTTESNACKRKMT